MSELLFERSKSNLIHVLEQYIHSRVRFFSNERLIDIPNIRTKFKSAICVLALIDFQVDSWQDITFSINIFCFTFPLSLKSS